MTLPILEDLTEIEALVAHCALGFRTGAQANETCVVVVSYGGVQRARNALSNLTAAIAEALPGSEPGALSTTDGGAPR